MCTRYSVATPLPALAAAFGFEFTSLGRFTPRHNQPPGEAVLAVRDDGDGPEAFLPTWGFAHPVDGTPLPNARAESAHDKPTFRDALDHRRCVLPADGFFEWTDGPDGRQPYYIAPAGAHPVGLAALWTDGPDGPRCVVLTRDADPVVRRLHPRMPVLLSPEDARRWLAPGRSGPDALADALARTPALTMRPVDRRMNDPAVDGPDVLAPPRQLRLF